MGKSVQGFGYYGILAPMKILHLNRHAKSSWAQAEQRDFDRPLNERGLRDAPEMAHRFALRSPSSIFIVSSPAVRAKATAAFFAEALKVSLDQIILEPRIYAATVPLLLSVINGLKDERDEVILFGHNPGFSLLTDYLAGDHISMPTCGIVTIHFEVKSWSEITRDCGSLVLFDYPKNNME